MKILSIDTSSNICGVSILEDTNLICKLDQFTEKTHSENLMPMIEQAFNQSNLSLNDIDLLVCDKGPGSFTGIRIGVSTVKAFHDSMQIPYVGISSLETLAYSVEKDSFIVSILDCKNDNCYFALYEHKNFQYKEIIAPSTDTIKNTLLLCYKAISSNNSIVFIGDGSEVYKDIINEYFKDCSFCIIENNLLNSYYLGLAGFNHFKENKQQDDDLLPLYLKKPQAQRQLEEKSKNIEISYMDVSDLESISSCLNSDFDDFWNYNVFKDELASENSIYIVSKLNNEVIGFAGFKILIDEANIMNIVVRKDFRNQGIGTLLLEKLISLSEEKKVNSITLEVMEENYSAIHLYKNFDFKIVGMRKNYYQDKNALIMKK